MSLFGKKDKKDENENKPEEIAPASEEKAPETTAESAISEETVAENTSFEPETVTKPMYETPEDFDFNRYFLAERRIILDNVSYETQRPVPGQLKLNVKDTIVAQVIGKSGVKVTYNRMLNFDPDGPFRLSVTFGVMLVFNPGTRDEVDWHTIDVANEFKKNCPQLCELMSAKASLIIAELTNANGGNPLMLKK